MYHFVSDADKSVYTSDDTQVSDIANYNCIANETNQILYAINNGMMLAWQKGGSIYEDDDVLDDVGRSQTVFHPYFAYNDLTVVLQELEENETDINSVPGGSDGGGGGGELQQCDDDNDCRQSYFVAKKKPRRARSRTQILPNHRTE